MSSDLPDINQGILKPDLFEKFKQQLQKDFETCSLECGFSKTLVSDYDLILSVISSEIRTISHSPGNLPVEDNGANETGKSASDKSCRARC